MTKAKEIKKKVGRHKTTVAEKVEAINFDFDKVQEIAKYGLTDEQLAIVLGVSETTITRWKKESPEFMTVLKKGKIEADRHVVDSLYKSATGYEYKEKSVEAVPNLDKKSADKKPTIKLMKEATKYQVPNPTSCIFWLKNRMGWKDKQDFAIEDAVLKIGFAEEETEEKSK